MENNGHKWPGGLSGALGAFTVIVGLAVGATIFLPWLANKDFLFWTALTGDLRGNFILVWGGGTLLFTGFWSLFCGLLILIGGLLTLLKKRFGTMVVIVGGAVGVVTAVFDIVMIFTRLRMESGALTVYQRPGFGLWLFLAFSMVALALGVVGFLRSGGGQGSGAGA